MNELITLASIFGFDVYPYSEGLVVLENWQGRTVLSLPEAFTFFGA